MQGLNTTPVHGHGALFGVYGMLGLGLTLMCLRALMADREWKEGLLKFAFWSMNIGLALMILLSLGSRLGLERDLIDSFVAREKLAGPHDAPLAEVQQLTQDTAELVSNVYHYTILELVRLAEFKPDSRWIARVLGITVDEVNVALNRLIRVAHRLSAD